MKWLKKRGYKKVPQAKPGTVAMMPVGDSKVIAVRYLGFDAARPASEDGTTVMSLFLDHEKNEWWWKWETLQNEAIAHKLSSPKWCEN